jgi:hypothetical protein
VSGPGPRGERRGSTDSEARAVLESGPCPDSDSDLDHLYGLRTRTSDRDGWIFGPDSYVGRILECGAGPLAGRWDGPAVNVKDSDPTAARYYPSRDLKSDSESGQGFPASPAARPSSDEDQGPGRPGPGIKPAASESRFCPPAAYGPGATVTFKLADRDWHSRCSSESAEGRMLAA